jgi:hypothetical protein
VETFASLWSPTTLFLKTGLNFIGKSTITLSAQVKARNSGILEIAFLFNSSGYDIVCFHIFPLNNNKLSWMLNVGVSITSLYCSGLWSTGGAQNGWGLKHLRIYGFSAPLTYFTSARMKTREISLHCTS